MGADTGNSRALQTQKLEALGRFAGGIAHDFNNILSIIEGHTQMAVRQLQDGTLTPDQLQKILLSTARGAGLTRQLLAFSRQKLGLDERIDLSAFLPQQQVLLEPLFGETVRLRFEMPPKQMWVEAAEDHIVQIILNLALNARDAMPTGGEVVFSLMHCATSVAPPALRKKRPGTDFVRLSVADSGVGIRAEDLPHIFEPFFSSGRQDVGTGLGLSVVLGLAEQMGGTVDVRSRRGQGSVFHVYIPASGPAALAVPENSPSPFSLRNRTILVAEDEPELRDILRDMLQSFDMDVTTAANGNEALAIRQQYGGEIDFLLTDIVMPQMDGVRLGSLFTAQSPETNVVYMSGYPFIGGRHQGIVFPEDADFISKPMQEQTVRQVLERALARRDARLRGENLEKEGLESTPE